MDIVCPQCSTEYEFDDAKVTESGVTVKCASCSYTFKVRRRQVVETEPVIEQAAPPAAPIDDRTWMVQTVDGERLRFKELPTLQQWIVERKVGRNDQISRSGETWKRLGEIAELSSFFQVVDAAISSGSPRNGALATATTLGGNGSSSPAFADGPDSGPTSLGGSIASDEPAFAAAAASVNFQTIGPSAAWEGSGRRVSTVDSYEADSVVARRPGKIIGLSVIGALLLGFGAFAAIKPQTVKGFFGGLFGDTEEVSEAYRRGRVLFLRDDAASLRQAEEILSKAPDQSVLALAARIEVATTWSQYLRDQSELLERQAQLLDAKAATALAIQPADPKRKPSHKTEKKREEAATVAADTAEKLHKEVAALRLRAGKSRDEAEGKLAAVKALAAKALARAPDRAEVVRSVADLRRMEGEKGEAVLSLLKKSLNSKPDDPETFYVEGAYWAGLGNHARAIDLLKEAIVKTRAYTQQSLLRAAFQLAMIDLRAGRRAKAHQHVDAILTANDKHGWATLLKEQIVREDQQGTPTVVAPTAPPTAPPDSPDPKTPATPTNTPIKTPPRAPEIPIHGGYSALVKAGDRLSKNGRTMKALSAYEAALAKNSNGVEALTGLAYCQLDLQRYSIAIRRFRKAMNISPTYGEAMMGMAEAYKAMGNKSKALDYFKAYLRAHPSGPKASMARRNIKEIEQELGPTAVPPPAPDPAPTTPAPAVPSPATPTPDPTPAPTPTPPANTPASP